MKIFSKIALASSMVMWSISSASALHWICDVPEIDGPAGISAVAVLVSAGILAYDRLKA